MNKKLLIILVGGLIAIFAGYSLINSTGPVSKVPESQTDSSTQTEKPPEAKPEEKENLQVFAEPIDRISERATKKVFGTKVSPQNSPVQPERFSGYHTGVDFETFTDEKDKDIAIKAICEGPLKVKRTATGYGGVLVQACIFNNQDITVVYGHIRLSSVTAKVDQTIKAGETLGVLGTGFSTETDGERKHLHLGIHKGSGIDLRGYVQSTSLLGNWINYLSPTQS